MRRSIFLSLILCFGLVSVAHGQGGRPIEERGRPSGRGSAVEPDSPAMTIALSQENQPAQPRLVKLGGVLTDSMGRPMSGEVEVTFALYKQEADEEPLWKETQKLDVDKQGGYTALLGATQPGGVPAELFRSDEARWLGVEVQGEPQRPRVLLVSVPYALKAVEAEKLEGKSASDFVLSESLGEQVRQVIQAQGEATTQTTSTGNAQQGQTKANSTLSPQMTPAGPMFPPSTFSGTTSNQVVLVQQQGTGAGLAATSLQNNAVSGQSMSGNGVYGQTAGTGASGVVGIATNPAGGLGVYAQSAFGAAVFGRGGSSGINGNATATSGFTCGLCGNGSSSPTGSGVFGSSAQWVGVGGQATATSGGPAYGVWGDSLSTDGAGVAAFADATSGPATGVFAQSASTGGTGVAGFAIATSGFTNGVSGQSASPNGNGVVGIASAPSGFNNGVYAATFSNEGAGVSGNAVSTSGNPVGVVGTNFGAGGGVGVWGVSHATSGISFGVRGDLEEPTASGAAGLFLSFSPTGVPGMFQNFSGQGLLLQGLSGPFNGPQKEVFSVDVNGNLQISGNLTVTGTKSSTARLKDGREVALYAVESPENWFEDFGSGEMNNGAAWVPLEASFAEATNAAVNYHVFLTANGDSSGLYVSRKTPAGFEVREHGGGASNVTFDYRIVVRRRGYEAIRMAEVHRDTKTSEQLAGLVNSGNLKKVGAVKVPRIVPPPAIRQVPPQPNVPAFPKPSVPRAPQPR
jgi:hypothetical protein